MRCRRCAGIVTPRWACKRCGSDAHLAHCHPTQDGCPPDCKHDWATWPHRHPHDGKGHTHGADA